MNARAAGPDGDDTRLQPPVVDPELAEEYAESVGIDPTSEQIDRYLQLEGDPPLGEPRELDEVIDLTGRDVDGGGQDETSVGADAARDTAPA